MLPPPLETDEEKCCLIALVDKNVAMSKEQAKKQLIEHNLRLVVYLAKKFENTGVCVEDLISIGTIGLYLTREIVTQQGGYVTVESQVGKGSAFSIFLPR